MLSRSERLRASEVAQVLARGRSLRAGSLQIKFLPAPALRTAAVVPKSLVRRANKRNALRRALYAAVRGAVRKPHILAVCLVRAVPPGPSGFAEDIAALFAKL